MEAQPAPVPGAAPPKKKKPLTRFLTWRFFVFVLAMTLWGITVIEHDVGGQIFARYFEYGKTHWGPQGRQLAEQRLVFTTFAIGLAAALLLILKLAISRAGRAAFPEIVGRWAVVLLCALAADRYLICIQSETIHFIQFGGTAFLLALATKNPRLAFVSAVFLGFLDELHQWRVIYWNEISQHLDWSDMCLNVCGAAAGALPFTTLARIRRYAAGIGNEVVVFKIESRVKFILAVLAFFGLLALLIFKTDLGHFPTQRPWEMLDNRKPFHTFSTKEGVPALLASAFMLYFVVDERRRQIPIRALVALLVAWHVGMQFPKNDGEPIHENVPEAVIPHAKAPITIDGNLGAEWQGALVLELHTFAPNTERQFSGVRGEKVKKDSELVLGPEVKTRARLLWDEKALYVAFECESQDVWARDLERDDPEIAGTPCVEVFLDTDCAERAYYEFEVTPANRVQDLYVYWPVPPQWIPNPTLGEEFIGLRGWDAKHLETAVKVEGDLDLLSKGAPLVARSKSPSKGYTVEMAIPWADLRGRALGLENQAKPGARFRANLFRVEKRRPETIPSTYMAWSPTHLPLDFHRPEFMGVLALGE